jgi:hypothetical protein
VSREALLRQSLADLAHRERAVRQQAVDALVRIGPPAVPALLERLNSPQYPLRIGAAQALARIGDPVAFPHFRTGVRDPDSRVRGWCVYALGELGGPTALALLIPLCRDDSLPLAVAAVEALARIGGTEAVEALTGLLRDPRCARVTREACAALGVCGDPSCIPLLQEVLRGSDFEFAEAAAMALAEVVERHPDPAARQHLPLLRRFGRRRRGLTGGPSGFLEAADRIERAVSGQQALPLPSTGGRRDGGLLPRPHGWSSSGENRAPETPAVELAGWLSVTGPDGTLTLRPARRCSVAEGIAVGIIEAVALGFCYALAECSSLFFWCVAAAALLAWGMLWQVFGEEAWIAGPNRLEHRWGWRFLRKRSSLLHRNSALEIHRYTSSESNLVSWSLVVHTAGAWPNLWSVGQPRSDEASVRQLGEVLSQHTGWPLVFRYESN